MAPFSLCRQLMAKRKDIYLTGCQLNDCQQLRELKFPFALPPNLLSLLPAEEQHEQADSYYGHAGSFSPIHNDPNAHFWHLQCSGRKLWIFLNPAVDYGDLFKGRIGKAV